MNRLPCPDFLLWAFRPQGPDTLVVGLHVPLDGDQQLRRQGRGEDLMPIIDRPLEFPDAQDRASDGPVEVLDPLGLDDPVQVLIENGPLTDGPTEGLLELLEQ